jgi:hypothetical protein
MKRPILWMTLLTMVGCSKSPTEETAKLSPFAEPKQRESLKQEQPPDSSENDARIKATCSTIERCLDGNSAASVSAEIGQLKTYLEDAASVKSKTNATNWIKEYDKQVELAASRTEAKEFLFNLTVGEYRRLDGPRDIKHEVLKHIELKQILFDTVGVEVLAYESRKREVEALKQLVEQRTYAAKVKTFYAEAAQTGFSVSLSLAHSSKLFRRNALGTYGHWVADIIAIKQQVALLRIQEWILRKNVDVRDPLYPNGIALCGLLEQGQFFRQHLLQVELDELFRNVAKGTFPFDKIWDNPNANMQWGQTSQEIFHSKPNERLQLVFKSILDDEAKDAASKLALPVDKLSEYENEILKSVQDWDRNPTKEKVVRLDKLIPIPTEVSLRELSIPLPARPPGHKLFNYATEFREARVNLRLKDYLLRKYDKDTLGWIVAQSALDHVNTALVYLGSPPVTRAEHEFAWRSLVVERTSDLSASELRTPRSQFKSDSPLSKLAYGGIFDRSNFSRAKKIVADLPKDEKERITSLRKQLSDEHALLVRNVRNCVFQYRSEPINFYKTLPLK